MCRSALDSDQADCDHAPLALHVLGRVVRGSLTSAACEQLLQSTAALGMHATQQLSLVTSLCCLLLPTFMQAFDDCTTLAATFKLLESFEGLLERDTIAAELAKKHLTMVTAFADDVKEVHELFLAHQEFPLLGKNSPPHSGAGSWPNRQQHHASGWRSPCTS